MAFVESLVYKSTNPMDVITRTKNYEPDCSSEQESVIEDDVFKIVF
jgi:hypothetical protein